MTKEQHNEVAKSYKCPRQYIVATYRPLFICEFACKMHSYYNIMIDHGHWMAHSLRQICPLIAIFHLWVCKTSHTWLRCKAFGIFGFYGEKNNTMSCFYWLSANAEKYWSFALMAILLEFDWFDIMHAASHCIRFLSTFMCVCVLIKAKVSAELSLVHSCV